MATETEHKVKPKQLVIQVTLDNEWFDEGYDLDAQLKQYIIDSVKCDILNSIRGETRKQINDMAIKAVNGQFQRTTKAIVRKFVKDGTVTVDNKETTVYEFLRDRLTSTSYYSGMSDFLHRKAEKIVESLKKRYDLAFASKVVERLADQKLLKDGLIETIMGTNKEK